ncbi:MAG TPA: ferredoxin reductase [Solirubrobacteraceae bacterium]|jgi:ferredoxin-NADP reductase|nr:ferredoxin reductase [Solirubrobacteraceae bacterium]
MPERGAAPTLSPRRRAALRIAGAFTSPLAPDDYLELVNPLWSTRELRGRVVAVQPEAAGAVTITIKPGWSWPGHRAGQFVRVGVEVGGRRHWRAYSLTSDPGRSDGCISITPKLVTGGAVSPYLCTAVAPGAIVRLGGVEGEFVLPRPTPSRLLFITAGSGVTPVAAMLRELERESAGGDVVHVHSAPAPADVIFGGELRARAARSSRYRLREQHTASAGRARPEDLERMCPDWRERETYACGPPELLNDLHDHFDAHGAAARLHVERFVADGLLDEGARGEGGTIEFTGSGCTVEADGSEPILRCGEGAGVELPHGCRMGICHSCVGRLQSGRVRDLRTGRVHGDAGELVRTCINAPEGDIEIEL